MIFIKMSESLNSESKEKNFVALTSVIAAVFLTAGKFIVGIMTGSLGILSEALHSALDLVAAIMTMFAVRISDKPADKEHQFGHAKIENLSAFFETFLLFITCLWIIYEAYLRITTGKTEIDVNIWSYAVVIASIIIDISRSRALSKAAKKYNSQALEADALHFSTDIFSSGVVLMGIIGASLDFHLADSIAALFVACIVVYITIKLGKKSIDALLDRSPTNLTREQISELVSKESDVINVHDIRLRAAGPITFIEMNIHVNPGLTIKEAHKISHSVENLIKSKIKRCEVHVHAEPEFEE